MPYQQVWWTGRTANQQVKNGGHDTESECSSTSLAWWPGSFRAQRPLPIWAALSDRMEAQRKIFRADWAKPGTPLGVWTQSEDHFSTASRLSESCTRAAYCQPFSVDQRAGGWLNMTLPSCQPFTQQASRKSYTFSSQEPFPTVTS